MPLHFAEILLANKLGAPRLGQHNMEVYRGLLGVSYKELAALTRDGVI